MITYNRHYALFAVGLYETMCFSFNEKYSPNQWNFNERFRHHMWRIKRVYGSKKKWQHLTCKVYFINCAYLKPCVFKTLIEIIDGL